MTNRGATYFPGGAAGTAANDHLAARGVCAIPSGSCYPSRGLHAERGRFGHLHADHDRQLGFIALLRARNQQRALGQHLHHLSGRCATTINEHVGLAGLTLRPMDTLQIYADFQFGYNDNAYTRNSPRQVQSYKIHADYKPRVWMTIDGAIDISENRDNVSQVNNLEHARTYGLSTILARNSNLTFTLGYNYTDLYLQSFICFRDNFTNLTSTAYPRLFAHFRLPVLYPGQFRLPIHHRGGHRSRNQCQRQPGHARVLFQPPELRLRRRHVDSR